MIRYVSLAVIFAASFALPAASQPAGTKESIQSVNRSYDQAFLGSDGPAKLTKFFTSDGTIISPTASAVNGEREIAAFWNTVFKVEFAAHTLQVVDVVPQGENAALAMGHWSATIKAQDGRKTIGGDFVQAWEKRPEGWKIRVVSWNMLPDRKEPIQ